MVKWLMVGLMIFSFSYAEEKCDSLDFQKIDSFTKDDVECAVKNIAEKAKKKTPIILDEITTIIDLSYDEKVLIYYYKIDMNAIDDFKVELKDTFKKVVNDTIDELKSHYCEKNNPKKLLELGMEVKHLYFDLDNNYLFDIFIDKKMCGIK